MNAPRILFLALTLSAPLAVAAPAEPSPALDSDDIGGVVTSAQGQEAGVWVIAETTELGTRFAKIAVTDEAGRYVIPDLPKAKYRLWVRVRQSTPGGGDCNPDRAARQ